VCGLAAYHDGVCSTQGHEKEQRFCGFRDCLWSCGETLCDEVGRQLRRVAGGGASRQRAPLSRPADSKPKAWCAHAPLGVVVVRFR
jgi:hypothetical protein